MTAAVSLSDQLASARREVKMRERVYPRWVATEKMTQAHADREIAAMKAIATTLEGLVSAEAPSLFPAS